jgi:hypothetical protein
MANTSATGGYLIPTTEPIEDLALEDIFQPAIAGITGLGGQFVRPRYQKGNPKQPEQDQDWCAFAVTMQKPDANPYLKHNGAGDGETESQRHEDLEVFISFYGYNAARNATRIRDGFFINQNSEAINAEGIVFVEAGEIRLVPELVNQQWIRRQDIRLRFRRKATRKYPILNIVAADINLVDASGHVDELIVISDQQ